MENQERRNIEPGEKKHRTQREGIQNQERRNIEPGEKEYEPGEKEYEPGEKEYRTRREGL